MRAIGIDKMDKKIPTYPAMFGHRIINAKKPNQNFAFVLIIFFHTF